jgi:pimeloyl-ACP methyl ester carboxylesterase
MDLAARSLPVRGHDGIRLAVDAFGDPGATPVVLLHGGGQTRHSWRGTAARLAASGYLAATVDLRGHGDSDWAPDGNYALEAFALDLVAVA